MPFKHNGFDGDQDLTQYYDAQFLEDWGPYKANQIVDCLVVDITDASVYHMDEAGNKLELTKVKFVPAGN